MRAQYFHEAESPATAGDRYRKVLDRLDACFGAFSMLMLAVAVVGRIRGDVTARCLVLLVVLLATNLAISRLALRRNQTFRWETVRFFTNGLLCPGIYVFSNGACALDWPCYVLVALGSSIALVTLTHKPFVGYAAALVTVANLTVTALIAPKAVNWYSFAVIAGLVGMVATLVTALLSLLHQTLVALGEEMRRREALEVELRLAQKLEAVGRLASGIAHEINTPVQFVGDSLAFVREATADLFALVDRTQGVEEGSCDVADDDLLYLRENVPLALDRALDGLERVATIVRSMKVFAHPDAEAMTSVDLNRAIESTLTIARAEYKYVADLETDLEATLPCVVCRVGDLNQAVLNIVLNAAHAIEDVVKGTDHRGRISVRTRREGEFVVIAVTDTGVGIPEAVRGRIFDPFFTTKEVGRGTGQGLAIARSVVVKHGGELTFETEVGKGTTFFVRLPIDGRRSEGSPKTPLAA